MIEETEETEKTTPSTEEPSPAAPMGPGLPPPVRRIVVDAPPTVAHAVPANHGAARPATDEVSGPVRMTLDELSVFYGTKPAVKQISLPIRQGEVLALIGPSGCGKTTLLRTLNRLTELTATARRDGTIALDGEDI